MAIQLHQASLTFKNTLNNSYRYTYTIPITNIHKLLTMLTIETLKTVLYCAY